MMEGIVNDNELDRDVNSARNILNLAEHEFDRNSSWIEKNIY